MRRAASIYDGGTLIASGGKMLVRGPRFSFADWLLTTAVIDIDGTRRLKAESFPEDPAPSHVGNEQGLASCDFEYPHVSEPVGSITTQTDPQPGVVQRARASRNGKQVPHQKEEEFCALGSRLRCSITCAKAMRKDSLCR